MTTKTSLAENNYDLIEEALFSNNKVGWWLGFTW
jgi:hypothetical protein